MPETQPAAGPGAEHEVRGTGPPAGSGLPAAQRLELARGVLRGAEGRARTRGEGWSAPDPGGDGRLLPVAAPLAGLFPAGGLRRGSTVAVPGSTSLLLALLAAASADGAWIGVVGRPDLGMVAAAEAGLRLDRVALVPYPGTELVAVTAALLDGLDVVVPAVPTGVVPAGEDRPRPLRAADRQRLSARARQRGAVLVAFGRWPGADVELECAEPRWEGLVTDLVTAPGPADGPGSGVMAGGRLRSRRVRVRSRGRVGRERTAELVVPGPTGAPAAVPGTPETPGSERVREAG